MIHFREMLPEDADAVAEVEKQCFPVPWSRESFWREASNENTLYLLALNDDEVIGYAGTWISFEEAQITNVAIVPEYRGNGNGRAMMEELICRVKEKGVTAMTLEVRPSNAVALGLYESLGFKDCGRRPKYYSDNGEDAIIMWNTGL